MLLTIQELSKAQGNNTDYNKTDISKTDPILSVPIRWKGQESYASQIFDDNAECPFASYFLFIYNKEFLGLVEHR